MAFFDKIGKKIGDVAGTAADKAKDLAETTKLNAAISSEEKQIDQYYLEIGKVMYEREKDNPDSPVAEQIKKILTSQQSIAEFKNKIAEIKEDRDVQPASDMPPTVENNANLQNTCPQCQTENSVSSKFCRNCGAPLTDKE